MNLAKSALPEKTRNARPRLDEDWVTIGELSRAFNLSLRTLRFYEDRGLLAPRREGSRRFYGSRDKARLEAILHGKHLGFTLTEIRNLLVAAGKPSGHTSLALGPNQIVNQLAHLERQRRAIEDAIHDLRAAQARLNAKPGR